VSDHPEEFKSELINNMREDGQTLPMDLMQVSPDESDQYETIDEDGDPRRSLKDLKSEAAGYIEKKAITQALDMTRWNKVEAARMLKISYKALFYKMNDYGMRKEKNHSAPEH
jgi:DNA-binding NtrC family response regulator